MHERGERAVSRKEAHVVEEVRLGKTVEEHDEKIRDTLRHTEVDIERLPSGEVAGVESRPGRGGAAVTRDYVPVVEERIEVGKREVDDGGVAAHSRVVEQPVEKDVRLRSERVQVDRRKVDREASEGDFRAGDVEMNEREERAATRKTARVVEEIRLKKTVGEHKETVHENLRHTELDIERTHEPRGWRDAHRGYRAHFDSSYSPSGATWDQYEPAYRFGHELGLGSDDWSTAERNARPRWERNSPGTWERFKGAIRAAFDRSRARVREERPGL
jgi:stress response protein YsnF